MTTGTQWIPYGLPWDDAPLDISFLFKEESPAGKHGFVGVQGRRLEFEDGTVARFWGTCFNSAANFPTHEQSEKVARRLAKFGINMMRPHQMDAEWSTPNIFQCTRGARRDDTQSFDPESMDRFDYLVHCLKQEGIYIYLDLLTYRRFKPGDGVDAVDQLEPAAKPYSCFDRRLIDLQKKFCRDLWTHVNPYTGLAYKDDPAVALTEIANEDDVFVFPTVLEPYRSRLEERYRAWAAERKLALPSAKIDFAERDETMMRFLSEVQRAYYREMYDCLREIGVRVPIAGTNWEFAGYAEAKAAEVCDFRDHHPYWDMWSDKEGNNLVMLAQREHAWAASCARTRLLDRPFFVSEWDQVWPNEWRAESPIMIAALSCFQEWSGLTIHTYRYRCTGPMEHMGGVVMYGVGYRVNFDTYNDPAKFGLFYHAALIVRRGDVASAREVAGLVLDEETVYAKEMVRPRRFARLAEQHRAGLVLPGQSFPLDHVARADDPCPPPAEGDILSDTGELCRNPARRIGWVDTPRTKAAYGFLGEAGELALKGLTLRVKTPFATIAISSLDDAPVEAAANLLLTTVGRADNTNARYNDAHTQRLALGEAPILIEVIEAEIEMRTTQPHLRVFAIDREGFIHGELSARIEGGGLKFEVGRQFPSLYYLIQRVG